MRTGSSTATGTSAERTAARGGSRPAESGLRILVFAPQVPWPPTQGSAIRNYHIVKALAKGHRVTLLAFGDPDADPGPLAAAGVEVIAVPEPARRTTGKRALDLVATTAPDLARRLSSETMRTTARLKAILDEPYDIVHVEGLEMAPFGLDVLQATPAGRRARLVYDAHNAEWQIQQRAFDADKIERRRWVAAAYSAIQTMKLRSFEARVLRTAWLTAAVSEADAAALRYLVPYARIVVVPNGVDTRTFRPVSTEDEDPSLVVFTGKMDYRPNVDAVLWFVGEVWPRITTARPATQFVIVGRDPAPAVRALGEVPGVSVTGKVVDVRPWLARAGVVVAPLMVGGGTRLKVLEAMAMSKAVVATRLAIEGLSVDPGVELEVADAPRDMAATIVGLLDDPARRALLGAAARRRVEFQYRWEQVGWELEAEIRRLADASEELMAGS